MVAVDVGGAEDESAPRHAAAVTSRNNSARS